MNFPLETPQNVNYTKKGVTRELPHFSWLLFSLFPRSFICSHRSLLCLILKPYILYAGVVPLYFSVCMRVHYLSFLSFSPPQWKKTKERKKDTEINWYATFIRTIQCVHRPLYLMLYIHILHCYTVDIVNCHPPPLAPSLSCFRSICSTYSAQVHRYSTQIATINTSTGAYNQIECHVRRTI